MTEGPGSMTQGFDRGPVVIRGPEQGSVAAETSYDNSAIVLSNAKVWQYHIAMAL
jgi:hypothetical protein